MIKESIFGRDYSSACLARIALKDYILEGISCVLLGNTYYFCAIFRC